MKTLEKVPSRQRLLQQLTMKVTQGNSLGKEVFLVYLEIKFLKSLTFHNHSLTTKIQCFQKFKDFRRFQVFVLSYSANSKRRTRRKIGNAMLLYGIVFFEFVDYAFCLTELPQIGCMLLSGVSLVSVKSTWPQLKYSAENRDS